MEVSMEAGTCEVCGRENMVLRRTTFYYGFKCECHSPEHFKVIRHCKDCEPKMPVELEYIEYLREKISDGNRTKGSVTHAITIKPSPAADSRSAKGNPSKDDLLASSVQHIGDVQKALAWFAGKLVEAGAAHDHTKISGIDDFYDSYSKKLTGDAFKAEKWFQSHLSERHHLNDRCPDDVTLIDVLERIADITMAGMARSGSIYDDNLDAEILQKAYRNTVRLLAQEIKVDKGGAR